MGDKTAASHHQAGTELWVGSRALGHLGPLISHGNWDRAVRSAAARLALQRHTAWRVHHSSEDPEGAEMAWLWHWITDSGCSAHDFTNALRWANLLYFGNRNLMKCMWVMVESLRSSLDQLIANLPSWLAGHLQFAEYAGAVDLHELWSLLGLSSSWCDELASLQLRFESDQLLVSPRFDSEADVPQRVANCLMHVYEYRGWSDTRWCAVGRISRRLVAGWLLGLSSLVAHVKAKPSESNYYLSGYDNLNSDIATMVTTCAVTAPVSEVALKLVLADSRVPLLLPELDKQVAAARNRILHLPMAVFDLLGTVCDTSGAVLAGKCCQSVCVQSGYAEMRLRRLRQLPWSLVAPSIEERIAKLRELKTGAAPLDQTARKIWTLLHVPVPMEMLATAVDLLGQLPHATSIVEQGHSYAAKLMRYHKNYTQDTLSARTMLCSMKPLVAPAETKLQGQLRRSRAKLGRLRRKQPSKCGARHLFLGAMLKRARRGVDRKKWVAGGVRNETFRNHRAQWDGRGVLDKLAFKNAVPVVREIKTGQIRKAIHEEVQNLSRLADEAKSEGIVDQPFRLTDCRLSSAEKVELNHMYSECDWSEAHVKHLRELACKPAWPPNAMKMHMLQSMAVDEEDSVQLPDYVGWMCQHRDYFSQCVLRIKTIWGDTFFQFVFAQQQPRLVCLLELEMKDSPDIVLDPSAFFGLDVDEAEHEFMITWRFRFSDEGFFPDSMDDISILSRVSIDLCSGVSCHGDWEPLQSLVAVLGEVKPTRHGSHEKAEKEAEFIPEAWMKHPAMWEFVQEVAKPVARRVRCKTAAPEASPEEPLLPGDEAVRALVERRAELHEDEEPWREHFVWKLRGGAWTGAHKGIAFDCYAAYVVKGSRAEEFVQCYGSLQRSASWSIRLYGEEQCLVMAKAWIHRMYHFFILWLEGHADETMKFSASDVDSYREPTVFAELATSADEVLQKRVRQIRSIVPR